MWGVDMSRARLGSAKGIVTFIVLVSLLVPATAYASSYWTGVSFCRGVLGAWRTYSGSNIRASLTATSSQNQTYVIRLYRKTAWTSGPVSTSSACSSTPSGYYSVRSWPGVGSGTYAFEFEKATAAQHENGIYVISNNVHLYNY